MSFPSLRPGFESRLVHRLHKFLENFSMPSSNFTSFFDISIMSLELKIEKYFIGFSRFFATLISSRTPSLIGPKTHISSAFFIINSLVSSLDSVPVYGVEKKIIPNHERVQGNMPLIQYEFRYVFREIEIML